MAIVRLKTDKNNPTGSMYNSVLPEKMICALL